MPNRIALAVITGELTPYRVHFHRRIAREMPEVALSTLLVVEPSRSAWSTNDPTIGTQVLAAPSRGSGRFGRWSQEMRTARAVWAWLNDNRPAAVLINGYNSVTLLAALAWCLVHDAPTLLWTDSNIRGDVPRGWRRKIKKAALPWLVRRYSACLACGSLGVSYFKRYGVEESQIVLCPVEPDYGQIEAIDPDIQREAAESFALGPGRRRIVVSSRLVAVKRIDMAIESFVRIADRRPDWDLVILGAGPLEEGLKASVPAHLRSRVLFTGFIGRQDLVTAVYRASEVLLHPATYEPWALVINEAACAGLAIVTTSAVGAAAELVRDGINGLIVTPGDPEGLTEALLEVTKPARTDAMRAASRAILDEWRAKADPINGLRAALRLVGAVESNPNRS